MPCMSYRTYTLALCTTTTAADLVRPPSAAAKSRAPAVHLLPHLLLPQDMLVLTHQLAKISTRLDQPLAALSLFSEAAGRHPGDIGLLLGQARLQEGLGNRQAALALYHQVSSSMHLKRDKLAQTPDAEDEF